MGISIFRYSAVVTVTAAEYCKSLKYGMNII